MADQGNGNPPIHPVQKRDNYICQYCDKDGLASLDNWHDSTIDHLIPKKHGGTDGESNLVTCCSLCNGIKGASLFDGIEEARDYILKRRGELQETFQRVVEAVRG